MLMMSAGNLMGSVLKSIKNIFSLEILINAKKNFNKNMCKCLTKCPVILSWINNDFLVKWENYETQSLQWLTSLLKFK